MSESVIPVPMGVRPAPVAALRACNPLLTPQKPCDWPCDLGEEKSALGAALSGQAGDLVRLLQVSDFSTQPHREIFQAIQTLVTEGEEVIEEVLLAAELRRRGTLDSVGGLAVLAELADGIVAARPMASRLQRLRALAQRRKLLTASVELARRCRDLTIDISETLNWLQGVVAQ